MIKAQATVDGRLSSTAQLQVLHEADVPDFDDHLKIAGLPRLQSVAPSIIQVNLGKFCNQRCAHCHVDAGPHQTSANMDRDTVDALLAVIERLRPSTVDLTGGAPELNPHFRYLVENVRRLGVKEVIDRCNLTVLLLERERDLVDFLADHKVHVVASLPAVNEKQTDAQRGDGIFQSSIKALQGLNARGYGQDPALELSLMSNPAGAFLPPPQAASERRFRQLLEQRYGIVFTRLIQLNNMPISRFLEWLQGRDGLFDQYMQRLSTAFNPSAVDGLMCRHTLSVGWDGSIYDCDFNQMLDLPVAVQAGSSIFNLRDEALAGRPIVVGKHCLGCTAGAGSSCGGQTA